MNIEDEMNDIANAETSGGYIDSAGTYLVLIKNIESSPANHTGCPYFEITFETVDDAKNINSTRLFRTREGDKPEAAAIKKKKIKELLQNAGADFSLKGMAIIKSAIGKKVQALFRKSEYPGVDGDLNNKPIIKTKIEYSFSGPANSELEGKQSYLFKSLSDSQIKTMEADMDKWERDNPTLVDGSSQTTSETDTALTSTPIAENTEDKGIGEEDDDPF